MKLDALRARFQDADRASKDLDWRKFNEGQRFNGVIEDVVALFRRGTKCVGYSFTDKEMNERPSLVMNLASRLQSMGATVEESYDILAKRTSYIATLDGEWNEDRLGNHLHQPRNRAKTRG